MPSSQIHAAPAQQPVDQAVVGQRADALEDAGRPAAREPGRARGRRDEPALDGPGDAPGRARGVRAAVDPAVRPCRCGRHARTSSSLSLRAARRRADFERGLSATSPGVGATERRNTELGLRRRGRSRRRAGRAGRCSRGVRSARKRLTRRSSSEWNEIAASRPPTRSRSQASGSAASSWASSSLTAIRIAWKVRLAGWPPANRAGAGIAAVIASTSSNVVAISAPAGGGRSRRRSGRRSAPRRSRAAARASRRGSHVLTISARGELLRRVHPHVERRVVGVGEAALARVDLHRGHAEVEVDHVGLHALLGERAQAVLEVGADEAACGSATSAASSANASSASGSRSIPISSAGGAEPVGDQARVAGGAERAVDGDLARAAGRAPRSARRRGPGRGCVGMSSRMAK